MNIESKLNELFRKTGKTGGELAKFAKVGEDTVSSWRMGDAVPHKRRLPILAAFFGVSVSELQAAPPQDAMPETVEESPAGHGMKRERWLEDRVRDLECRLSEKDSEIRHLNVLLESARKRLAIMEPSGAAARSPVGIHRPKLPDLNITHHADGTRKDADEKRKAK